MNILVTGANGQLGNEIRIVAQNSPNHYIFTDVDTLDITDAAAVISVVKSNEINVIINCAAYTNVDKAEDDFDNAYILNNIAVGNLANAAKSYDATLIHISTDYVFGGNIVNIPIDEEIATNPTGVYGLTKLKGEQAIVASQCKHIIIRTSWLYSEYGKNFVKTILTLIASKPSLQVVFDQVGTPTYAYDLAKVICYIVDNKQFELLSGIFNYSNEGVCSWYDFAVAIAELSGNNNCKITPCHSDEFPSKVMRPSYSVLDKTKIKNALGIAIPHWYESLKECVNKLSR